MNYFSLCQPYMVWSRSGQSFPSLALPADRLICPERRPSSGADTESQPTAIPKGSKGLTEDSYLWGRKLIDFSQYFFVVAVTLLRQSWHSFKSVTLQAIRVGCDPGRRSCRNVSQVTGISGTVRVCLIVPTHCICTQDRKVQDCFAHCLIRQDEEVPDCPSSLHFVVKQEYNGWCWHHSGAPAPAQGPHVVYHFRHHLTQFLSSSEPIPTLSFFPWLYLQYSTPSTQSVTHTFTFWES